MGSPADSRNRLLATYDWAGLVIRDDLTRRFPASPVGRHTILDVGAGWGKYRTLLPEYVMDAVEVWRPYILAEHLADRYRQVFDADIADIHIGFYDVVILGDVFEHLPRRKARLVLDRLLPSCADLFVAVPFTYEQEMVNHNPFEIHHQTDLTPGVMADVYPELQPLAFGDGKGIYVKAAAE